MNSKNTIVVVMATYNGEKYIREQLESLRNQTHQIDRVIIGDDCSNDRTVEIVEAYIKEYSLNHWSISINKKNLGHAENFICLCRETKEDYVLFCDQDDIWRQDKVELLVGIMESQPAINLIYGEAFNTVKGGEEIVCSEGIIEKISFTEYNYFFKGLGCGTCVRGAFLRKHIKYWRKNWEHDMFFWACAILEDSAYHYTGSVLNRRIHDSNASIKGEKTLEKRILQCQNSLSRIEALKQLIDDNNIVEQNKVHFIKKYESVLRKRCILLKARNPGKVVLISVWLILYANKYYLHGYKGIGLDIYLRIFDKYTM